MSIALQINLHPFDAPHVTHTLRHQLQQFGDQVDRIVLSVDTSQNRRGRYRGAAYEENRRRLFNTIEEMRRAWRNIAVSEIDYSSAAQALVNRRFFAGVAQYPARAFDGGPFHAYFYGLAQADARYVLHMDADMLFGGGSQTWMSEAVAMLKANDEALFVGPLPGPPRADGALIGDHEGLAGLDERRRPERLAYPFPAYRFSTVSTRIFMIDLERFERQIGALALLAPRGRDRLRARLFGQAPITLPAETVLSAAMRRRGLWRIDFLGGGAGMYSLHPPYRTARFYRDLPELIARIAANDLPDGQRGDYDINASLFDWSEALRQKRIERRVLRYVTSIRGV